MLLFLYRDINDTYFKYNTIYHVRVISIYIDRCNPTMLYVDQRHMMERNPNKVRISTDTDELCIT